jgi:CheY-like chemotaxis protein
VGIRKTASDLLAALGFNCQTAADPKAGLRVVRKRASVEIIMCEHSLPQIDALQFVEELRQSGFNGQIFVYANQLEPREQEHWSRCRVDRLVIGPGALADILQEMEVLSLQRRSAVLAGSRLQAGTQRPQPALSV